MADGSDRRWLTWARKLLAIAQNGLTYADNPYDVDRYEQVKSLAAEIMETRSDLKQRTYPPAKNRPARRGFRNSTEDLEQSRLARPVATDNPENFAPLHLKRYVAQSPEIIIAGR